MRRLSKRQKRVIKEYTIEGYFNNDWLIGKNNNMFILITQLEKINDYETLYQDVTRLINDIRFENTLDDKLKLIDNFK
jgi:hypothetical protein